MYAHARIHVFSVISRTYIAFPKYHTDAIWYIYERQSAFIYLYHGIPLPITHASEEPSHNNTRFYDFEQALLYTVPLIPSLCARYMTLRSTAVHAVSYQYYRSTDKIASWAWHHFYGPLIGLVLHFVSRIGLISTRRIAGQQLLL